MMSKTEALMNIFHDELFDAQEQMWQTSVAVSDCVARLEALTDHEMCGFVCREIARTRTLLKIIARDCQTSSLAIIDMLEGNDE
jgi:hypothetical protein